MKVKKVVGFSFLSIFCFIVLFIALFNLCTPFQAAIQYGSDIVRADASGWTPLRAITSAVGKSSRAETSRARAVASSAQPASREQTTGTPQAIDSLTTRPHGSPRLGKIVRFAAELLWRHLGGPPW